jgi:hypothetical protein
MLLLDTVNLRERLFNITGAKRFFSYYLKAKVLSKAVSPKTPYLWERASLKSFMVARFFDAFAEKIKPPNLTLSFFQTTTSRESYRVDLETSIRDCNLSVIIIYLQFYLTIW